MANPGRPKSEGVRCRIHCTGASWVCLSAGCGGSGVVRGDVAYQDYEHEPDGAVGVPLSEFPAARDGQMHRRCLFDVQRRQRLALTAAGELSQVCLTFRNGRRLLLVGDDAKRWQEATKAQAVFCLARGLKFPELRWIENADVCVVCGTYLVPTPEPHCESCDPDGPRYTDPEPKDEGSR